MALVVRPLIQWLRWQHQSCGRATLHHLLNTPSLLAVETSSRYLSFTVVPCFHRSFHFRSRAVKLRNAPVPSDFRDRNSDGDNSDPDAKKSRNQKKREARRAVRWGMELAAFSPLQIKRILRAASFEREVFDAIMLVKRLGRDVREGKRRQFNFIGRLLREVEPELMDGLIQATKDGDMSKFQALSGSENIGDDEEFAETESESEYEEVSHNYIDIATRWFDGLINKEADITKEIYSIQDVDFDRQEFRRLVREVHSKQERQVILEENEGGVDAAIIGTKRSLNRFLRTLAKQLPTE